MGVGSSKFSLVPPPPPQMGMSLYDWPLARRCDKRKRETWVCECQTRGSTRLRRACGPARPFLRRRQNCLQVRTVTSAHAGPGVVITGGSPGWLGGCWGPSCLHLPCLRRRPRGPRALGLLRDRGSWALWTRRKPPRALVRASPRKDTGVCEFLATCVLGRSDPPTSRGCTCPSSPRR